MGTLPGAKRHAVRPPLGTGVSGDCNGDNQTAQRAAAAEERLPQKLSGYHSFGMSFCIISYLYFVIGGYMYIYGGWAVMVWTWAVCSLGSLAIAVSLAETASACPVNSGLYYYAARLAPRRYRASASFAVAWLSLLGTLASVLVLMNTLANFVEVVIYMFSMDENGDNAHVLTPWQHAGLYCGVVLVSTLLNSFSILVTAALITFGTLFNCISFVALLGTLIAVAPTHQPASFVFAQHFMSNADITGITSPSMIALLALYAPINGLYGFDAVIFMTEETEDATRVVPRAMVSSIAAVCAMSWVTIVAFGFCVQSPDTLLDPDAAAGGLNVWLQVLWDTHQSAFGNGRGGLPLAVFVMVSSLVSLSLWNTGVARKLHSMSRDGLVPASEWLAHIDPVTHTPQRAVWTVHAMVLLPALLLPFKDQFYFSVLTAFNTLATYSSYLIPIFLRLAAPARLQPLPGRFDIGQRWRPWISGTAICYIFFCYSVAVLPWSSPTTWQTTNYTGPALGLLFGLLAAAYWAPQKLGGVRHWWRGPRGGRIAGIAYAMWD